MKIKLILMTTFYMLSFFGYAQTSEKPFKWENAMDNIVMTWNKSTPEQEMKDDIKALAEHGVTVKYANVKRNDKNEITAIDVSFEAITGEKGSLSYNNKKPIATIKIYKNGDEVGFGEPSNSSNPFITNWTPNEDFMKDFDFHFEGDSLSPEKFMFKMPKGDSFSKGKSKIIIKKDGKKPLVIENGEVIDGGDDYTKEEIEEIKQNNKFEMDSEDGFHSFHFNDDEFFSSKKNLEESKKELEKAKKELEEAKKELEKTKSSLKVKKA